MLVGGEWTRGQGEGGWPARLRKSLGLCADGEET